MAFSNFGINGSHFKPGKLSLASDTGGSETVVLTSSTQGTVSLNASQITASYAKITYLDVEEINSISRTETTLEVVDKLIVAASGSNAEQSSGGGLQIGGTDGSDTVASVLYDDGSSALDMNIAGTTHAALSSTAFSASAQLQGASVAVDGAVTAGTSFIIGSADLNETDLEKLDQITDGTVAANKAVVADANKDASGFRNIDGTGDLTMATVTMTGFSVDADGDVVARSLNNSSGGITNAGSIAGATTIDASGDLTVGTITNAEFTVDASGNTDIDGTLNVENGATLQSTLSAQSASFTTIYGSGAAQIAGALRLEGALSMDNASVSDAGHGSFVQLTASTGVKASSFNADFKNLTGTPETATFKLITGSLGDQEDSGGHFEFELADGDNNSDTSFSIKKIGGTTFFKVEGDGRTDIDGDVFLATGHKIQSPTVEVTSLLHGEDGGGDAGYGLDISATGVGDYDSANNHVNIDFLGTNRFFRFRDNSADDGSQNVIAQFSSASAGGVDFDMYTGSISNAVNIDGTGDLTMATITMTGFSVDADGDVVARSLNNSNGGITNAGSIAGATTIDASGDLTVGTITNAEFTVDASGNTDIDGTLNVENGATLQSTLSAQSASFSTVYGSGAAQFANTLLVEGAASMSSTLTVESTVSGANGTFDALAGTSLALQGGGISAAGSIAGATSIDGTGDLTMGTITMTGFTVDADGDLTAKSIVIPDDATIGAVGDTDMITLDAGADVTFASDLNVVIGKAGGLNLADGAVTSTAAELNLVDGSSAGSVVNSKAVIYSAGGEVAATTLAVGGGYGSTGLSVTAAGVLSLDGQLNHAANIIPAANGSQNIGSTSYRYNAVYANNVYTGDFHMKNERGDWTLFEESDHIRIRNNKTGQTFKLGMSLIEE